MPIGLTPTHTTASGEADEPAFAAAIRLQGGARLTASFQLVTFMELLEHNAEAFWRLSSLVGQLFTRLETGLPDLNVIASNLGELRREAERLGIRSAVVQTERISELVQGDRWGNDLQRLAELMRPLVVDLHLRIMDDLDDRFFLALPPESVSYYNQKHPLFGSTVESKFPQMSEDISEAGKCLALERSTAAVFHLMRVMEIAVQKFGDKLGVALASQKNWQNILDEINKSIKSMDQRAPLTKAYACTSSNLYNVKLAWRNEVMHPKQTYTNYEAHKVFDAVNTFINDLAGLI